MAVSRPAHRVCRRGPMIKPELEFVYEAGGELEPPREIGKVVDGTRRIIPITAGGYVKGPKISGKLMGNSADWQLTRPDGVTGELTGRQISKSNAAGSIRR